MLRTVVSIALAISWPGLAASQPPAAVAPAAQLDTHRLSVDAVLSIGVVVTLGGSLHFEQRYAPNRAVTYRAGYRRGSVIMAEESDGFDALVAQIGWRAYLGSGYLELEAGGTAIRQRRFYDEEAVGAKWNGLPSAAVSLGVKAHGVDFGISGSFPFVGVGVQLGVDFTAW